MYPAGSDKPAGRRCGPASRALPVWTGILTYASMLRSPAGRAPCILPVLTNRRGEGADRQAEAFDYFIYNAGPKDGVIDGGLVIFASGNEYAPMSAYPAAYPDYICVSSTSGDDSPSSYTNYGVEVDISAPGGDAEYHQNELGSIFSTMTPGQSSTGYGYMDGTSMACPHVSGDGTGTQSAFLPVSCEEDKSYEDNTPAQITNYDLNGANSGKWELVQIDGNDLPEGLFQYVIFNTKDNEFEFIQNLNSQTSTSITGTYVLEYDEYEGNILSGRYDHASGLWLNDYVISGLTPESMVWTVLGDPESYYVYRTCRDIPADRLPDVKSM